MSLRSEAGCPPFVLPDHHGMTIVLISPFVDLVGQCLNQALNQRCDRESVLQIARHVADTHFDRAEVMVRPDVPPDFPNRIDKARVDHVVDEPNIFAPVSHQCR